jgi:prefoldin subunit 5
MKRLRAENDVFRRALQLLQGELEEIEKEYGKDPNAPDAVKALSNEVSILKSNIEEIKNYLAQLTSAGQRSPQQNQWGQMPLTVFPQNTAGLLPYISTPNIPPIMPQINNNNRSF